jgi:LEM3 (ligand-effect modulator 3) family / CDC50 family
MRLQGTKSLILSSNVGVGGTDGHLGLVFLITGGLSVLCGLMFIALRIIKHRPLGNDAKKQHHA